MQVACRYDDPLEDLHGCCPGGRAHHLLADWQPRSKLLTRRHARPALTKSCLKSAVAVTAANCCSSRRGSGGTGSGGDASRHALAALSPPAACIWFLNGCLRLRGARKAVEPPTGKEAAGATARGNASPCRCNKEHQNDQFAARREAPGPPLSSTPGRRRQFGQNVPEAHGLKACVSLWE